MYGPWHPLKPLEQVVRAVPASAKTSLPELVQLWKQRYLEAEHERSRIQMGQAIMTLRQQTALAEQTTADQMTQLVSHTTQLADSNSVLQAGLREAGEAYRGLEGRTQAMETGLQNVRNAQTNYGGRTQALESQVGFLMQENASLKRRLSEIETPTKAPRTDDCSS